MHGCYTLMPSLGLGCYSEARMEAIRVHRVHQQLEPL